MSWKVFVVEIKDCDSVKQSGFSGSFISAHLHADSDTRKKGPIKQVSFSISHGNW